MYMPCCGNKKQKNKNNNSQAPPLSMNFLVHGHGQGIYLKSYAWFSEQ